MTPNSPKPEKPLVGWRVLLPRGGPWGDSVAASLRSFGAVPVVAPLINFAPTNEPEILDAALARLSEGYYDWLTVTSATTVDVLFAHRVKIPRTTKIAAVGETTATALESVGYEVALVPDRDNSAEGMAEQMIALETEPRRVLALRSESAKPILSTLLEQAGHAVDGVVAYRTVGVPVTPSIRRDVENGRINAILVTSGSVAAQVREQFPEIPDTTILAAIGPRTAGDAAKAGLPIQVIADKQTADALIEAVSRFTLSHASDEYVS